MNTKVRPDGQLLCGEKGSCQSLPTNPCGTAFGVGRWQIVQLEQGSYPASLQNPITDGFSAIRPISDESAQRYPLAPGPWEPSSRSTSTLSRGPVTQSQAPGQEQVNGEGRACPPAGHSPICMQISPMAQVALLQTEMNSGFRLVPRMGMNSAGGGKEGC